MAGRGGIERTTEIAAADFADFFRRETLLHHLRHHREIKSDFLVRPNLVRPLANARSSTARPGTTSIAVRPSNSIRSTIRPAKPVGHTNLAGARSARPTIGATARPTWSARSAKAAKTGRRR